MASKKRTYESLFKEYGWKKMYATVNPTYKYGDYAAEILNDRVNMYRFSLYGYFSSPKSLERELKNIQDENRHN
jgi:hypothetical protein